MHVHVWVDMLDMDVSGVCSGDVAKEGRELAPQLSARSKHVPHDSTACDGNSTTCKNEVLDHTFSLLPHYNLGLSLLTPRTERAHANGLADSRRSIYDGMLFGWKRNG
jgi:hypothetical protein